MLCVALDPLLILMAIIYLCAQGSRVGLALWIGMTRSCLLQRGYSGAMVSLTGPNQEGSYPFPTCGRT